MKFLSDEKLTEICRDKYFCLQPFHKHQLRFPRDLKYVEKILVCVNTQEQFFFIIILPLLSDFFPRFLFRDIYLLLMTGSESPPLTICYFSL